MHTLVDIGLNLTHDSFAHDRDALLVRAAESGVAHMLITGASLSASQAAIELARTQSTRLRATAGVHPHHATELSDVNISFLRQLATQPEVLAVGECGLDYFRNFSPPADQQRAFALQLELASDVGKPLFLHQRDAHEDFLALLKPYLPRMSGVAHCFTGNWSQAKSYLDLGLYIGVTGWLCDERRGQDLRNAVRHIPLDRLLLETDAPYLLPRDLQPAPKSRRNEPAFLPHVLKTLAAIRGDDLAALAAATTANAKRLFGWP
jgi:TatD DNase family protein